MESRLLRRSIFISALVILGGLVSFHPSWIGSSGPVATARGSVTGLSNEDATLAQDPNASLPAPKKTTPAKKTTPPTKSTPRRRTNSGSASVNMPRTFTNQTGIEFVLIPPGSFMMGSTNHLSSEKPVHQVTINYSFYMGKYEVTQAQWQSVMGSNPSYFARDRSQDWGNCPVEEVSWDDAQAFIRKLNQMGDGYTYRLPTEAEWEYACRAGTTGDYAGNLNDMAWSLENSGKKTHAVGSKQPNAWGLADMHGNVWEWCEDWYHETYYGAPTDGSAWLSGGEQKFRVVRGGSWFDFAFFSRSAFRNNESPDDLNGHFGFRLVAVVRTQ